MNVGKCSTTHSCGEVGFPNPNDCTQCVCPEGVGTDGTCNDPVLGKMCAHDFMTKKRFIFNQLQKTETVVEH